MLLTPARPHTMHSALALAEYGQVVVTVTIVCRTAQESATTSQQRNQQLKRHIQPLGGKIPLQKPPSNPSIPSSAPNKHRAMGVNRYTDKTGFPHGPRIRV